MILLLPFFIFFFFNDTATTEIYTLSLHDALPILHPLLPARSRVVREGYPRPHQAAPVQQGRAGHVQPRGKLLRRPGASDGSRRGGPQTIEPALSRRVAVHWRPGIR